MPDIEGKINQILVSDLKLDPDLVQASTPHTPLLGRGIGIDSMETLILVSAIEREFDILVEDEELNAELFTSIAGLAAFIQHKIKSGREFGDEKIKAVIVTREACSVEEITGFGRNRIADFKIPSLVEFTHRLPKTSTGKIRKKLLL